ncbi:hypothetical protein HQ544_03240 [Candidatus Falkowbacteria bacterium]|nr:hypothetical protein [Candidatus Falkowbacteria bacterium]
MKKVLFFILAATILFGSCGFVFSDSVSATEGDNRVILTEPGEYVLRPQWFNSAARSWISLETSLTAKLSRQYSPNLLWLEKEVPSLSPGDRLLIVDGSDPKNQIEVFEINRIFGSQLLETKKALKNNYEPGSDIKFFLKKYYGYYPDMGADVDLGYFEAGEELVFSHLSRWSSRFNKTGHKVFGPNYSTDSRYYKITQLSPTSWQFDFDEGTKFDGGYNDGSFIVERKFVVIESGTMEIKKSYDTPEPSLVIGGVHDVTLAIFDVSALNEEMILDRIKLTGITGDESVFSPNDIDMLYLYDEDGNMIASRAINKISATFWNLGDRPNKFSVPDGEVRKLYVKADLSRVGSLQPGVSGHKIGYKIARAEDFSSRGRISGAGIEVIGFGGEAPVGSIFTMVKGMPVVLERYAFVPAADSVDASDLMLYRKLYRFDVSADPRGGNIGLYKVMFRPDTGAASATDFYLYDITFGDRRKVSQRERMDDDGLVSLYFNYEDWQMGEERIMVGETRTYELLGSVSSMKGFSVAMLGDGEEALVYPGNAEMIDSSGARFIWSDMSQNIPDVHSTSTFDWYNGYQVPGLPATSTSAVFTD